MTLKKGINSLGYVGVTAKSPPGKVILKRDPVVGDWRGHSHGTIWLNSLTKEVFILTDIVGSSGTMHGSGSGSWLKLQSSGGAAGDLIGIVTDDANTTTNDANGDIRLSGGTNIETYEIGPSTIGIKMPANIVTGGTINPTILNAGALNTGILTDLSLAGGGLVKASVLGTLGLTPDGVNGEILIGSTTGDTTWGNITSGAEIIITNTPNNIEVKTTRGANGELLIRGTGIDPVWSTITAGPGITITNTPNGILIEATNAGNDMQIGTMIESDLNHAPGGAWLPCNGALVNQADYPELFATIGHKYKSSTFEEFKTGFSPDCATVCPLSIAHNGQSGTAGMWVAGGGGPNLGYSTDGRTWINIGPTLGITFKTVIEIKHNGLVGSAGLWVALCITSSGGHAIILTSKDGISWIKAFEYNYAFSLPYNPANYVAHNGLSGSAGLWIVKIGTIYYMYSNNGISWTKVRMPFPETHRVKNVTPTTAYLYKSGLWICFAYALKPDVSTAGGLDIYSSTTGKGSWKKISQIEVGASSQILLSLAAEGVFVISREEPHERYVLTSTNGVSWTKRPAIRENQYYYNSTCIAYNDGVFMSCQRSAGIVRQTRNYKEEWIDEADLLGGVIDKDFQSKGISSNHLTGEDSRWAIIAYRRIGTAYQILVYYGGVSFDIDTQFRLPYRPGYIILS